MGGWGEGEVAAKAALSTPQKDLEEVRERTRQKALLWGMGERGRASSCEGPRAGMCPAPTEEPQSSGVGKEMRRGHANQGGPGEFCKHFTWQKVEAWNIWSKRVP